MKDWEYESILKLFYDHVVEGISLDKAIKMEKERLRVHAKRTTDRNINRLIDEWIDFEMHSYETNTEFLNWWYNEDDRRKVFVKEAYSKFDLNSHRLNSKPDEIKGVYYILREFAEETLDA